MSHRHHALALALLLVGCWFPGPFRFSLRNQQLVKKRIPITLRARLATWRAFCRMEIYTVRAASVLRIQTQYRRCARGNMNKESEFLRFSSHFPESCIACTLAARGRRIRNFLGAVVTLTCRPRLSGVQRAVFCLRDCGIFKQNKLQPQLIPSVGCPAERMNEINISRYCSQERIRYDACHLLPPQGGRRTGCSSACTTSNHSAEPSATSTWKQRGKASNSSEETGGPLRARKAPRIREYDRERDMPRERKKDFT